MKVFRTPALTVIALGATLALHASDAAASRISPADPDVSVGGPYVPPSVGGPVVYSSTIKNLNTGETFTTIQAAIDDTDTLDGHVIEVQSTPHAEGPQITVTKGVTIQGGAGGATIQQTANTGSSGNARGWFLVSASSDVHFKNLSFDGNGFLVHQGIRATGGGGSVDNCSFDDITYQPTLPYAGTAVVFFGSAPWDISNSTFTNIGRNYIFAFGAGVAGSTITGNTCVGKGVGDHLDYGIEVGGGATATISGNTISNCLGQASSDGSISACVLITDFFGPGTAGTLTGNSLFESTDGIAIGFLATDASVVIANQNCIFSNDSFGISQVGTVTVDAENNWWGSTTGPFDPVGTSETPPCNGDPDDDANADGAGNAVSTNGVDYCPWLTAPAACPLVTPVPTVSEWGLILMTLLGMVAGTILFVRRHGVAMAGVSVSSADRLPLFSPEVFLKAFTVCLALAAAGMAVAIALTGPLTAVDTAGTLISTAIVAYLAHLWIAMRRG